MNVILFLSFIAVVCAENNYLTACEDGTFPDVAVLVEGIGECITETCIVNPGKEVLLQMNFTSPEYLDQINPTAIAHTDVMDFPFPIFVSGCDGIVNTPCPIVKNEKVVYEFSLVLPAQLPEIQLGLTFALTNGRTSKNIVCFNIKLAVQNN